MDKRVVVCMPAATSHKLCCFRVRWVTPATAHLSDGTSLYGVPAPGSGNLLTFIFNILDGYQYSQHRPRKYGQRTHACGYDELSG